ncbi:MAG: hypothetical protein QNJ70_07130 [Xenococcaceae cyanobacterium MO_207.B15]|nr:hypothetical protein [Xenococcaceae cyanobacterium MO_207.B15]
MTKSDSGQKVDKLSWGDGIENQAKQLLQGLLLLAAEENCWCSVNWASDKESNLYILTFENITIETIVNFINNHSSEIENYLETIKNKKNQTNKLLFKLSILEILVDRRKKDCKSGIWKFDLKLPSKEIAENLEYFCDKWDKVRPAKSKKISDKSKKLSSRKYKTQLINTGINTIHECIVNVLGSLDCESQERRFLEKVCDDNNNKRGVFCIRAEKNIQPWFLWRLTRLIGDYENAKLIRTKIDYTVKHDFNNFWQKFSQYIKITGELKRSIVIERLTDYHQTKSVVIVVNRFDELPEKHFFELLDFWNELLKKIDNIQRTNIQKKKSWFVLFLVSNNINCTNNKNENTKSSIIDLSFTEITEKELDNWLSRNQNSLKERNYNLEAGYEIANNPPINPYDLIDDICCHVFQLNNGIAEVEHYWKNIS